MTRQSSAVQCEETGEGLQYLMAKYKYKMYQLSGPLMTSGAGSSKSGTIIVDCSQEQCAQLWSGHGNLPLFSSYLWQVTASFLGQQQQLTKDHCNCWRIYPIPACADL